MSDLQDLRVSIRRRFEFIEFQLHWEGSVGRKKLQEQFSISLQQATIDLTSYMDACPGNMIYDPRQKTYVPTATFRPILIRGEASEYLMHLDILKRGYREKGEVWAKSIPVFDAVSVHSRRISSRVLKDVLQSMRSQICLYARYFSLSSDNSGFRLLLPHAIASDGHRWHMRAYDLARARYSDFVLSRLERTELRDKPAYEVPADIAWHTSVDVILKADPSLDQPKRERLEYEYEMTNGHLRLTVRQAMLFYYLRHYGFDPRKTQDGKIENGSSFLLCIENIEEVERCIGRRSYTER